MRPLFLVFLSLALASGTSVADDKPAKSGKDKPAAKSDKNVFQKTESSIGDWANRNKIWVTRKKSDKKKD